MLTVKDHQTLGLEERRWRFVGSKESEIRLQFSESPARYYQRLAALIERPDVLAEYPMTVRRLQRLRDARRAARATVVA